MALNAAAHHSAAKVAAGEKNSGLRAQTTFSAGRPSVLTEPEPQREAVTVGHVAAPGPLLEVSSMAGGDSVDGTTLWYLLKHAIEMRKLLEEEERRKKEERNEAKLQAHLHAVLSSYWVQERKEEKRRKKKRKKKKLPKSSLRSSFGRSRRRFWQWHVQGCGIAGFIGLVRCVPFCSWKAQMLCIMAGVNQRDSNVAR